MISFRQKGDFSKTTKYLTKLKQRNLMRNLERFGKQGVDALSSATPVDTGLTAGSWYYKIEIKPTFAKISFCNSNIQNGVPVAVILQYGHATGNGGWVEGRDYINPAIQPIFDKIANSTWEEVTKL
jgi:hypothetical protein